MTERVILGQAQRILVDATSDIWHKISLWTHASDVEMPDGTPLNTYLTDMNDEFNEKFDHKYGSLPDVLTDIRNFDAIPDLTYGRLRTLNDITAGKYTIPSNHFLYSYSGSHPNTIQRFAVLIDTTDLANIVMYIADKNIENRWTLTKIANQEQIDDLQNQINELNSEFNNLNLFVQQSIGGINQLYQVLQNQMDWLEQQLEDLQEQVNDLLNELRDFKRTVDGKFQKIEKDISDLNKEINDIWNKLNECCDQVNEEIDKLWEEIERLKNKDDVGDIINKMYGSVGSIFITHVQGLDPASIFGGTWRLIDNAYLFGGSSVQPYGTYLGNSNITLTEENLPPHKHMFGDGSGSYYHDGMWNVRSSYGADVPVPSGYPWNLGGGSNYLMQLLDRTKVSGGGNSYRQASNGTAFAGGGKSIYIEPKHFNVFCWMRTS